MEGAQQLWLGVLRTHVVSDLHRQVAAVLSALGTPLTSSSHLVLCGSHRTVTDRCYDYRLQSGRHSWPALDVCFQSDMCLWQLLVVPIQYSRGRRI